MLTSGRVTGMVLDGKTNNIDYFKFTYRWYEGVPGIRFHGEILSSGEYVVKMSVEKNGELQRIRSASERVHFMLLHDKSVEAITWFDLDGNSYKHPEKLYE
jgi:hypothetical protein